MTKKHDQIVHGLAWLVAALCPLTWSQGASAATVAPLLAISGPITGPAQMHPNPPISVVPDAVSVDSFPYVTEEYFVSGTAKGAPYTTRIIVRHPSDANSFSGVVVAEALHAGGRSLIFEWSRVSILTWKHVDAVRADVKATTIP